MERGTLLAAAAAAAAVIVVAAVGMLDSGQVFGTDDHARAPSVPTETEKSISELCYNSIPKYTANLPLLLTFSRAQVRQLHGSAVGLSWQRPGFKHTTVRMAFVVAIYSHNMKVLLFIQLPLLLLIR